MVLGGNSAPNKNAMKQTSLPPLAPLTSAAVNQRAYQLLYAIEDSQFRDLVAFAAWQLCVGCRHPGAAHELLLKEGADLLHDAFEDILVGLRDLDRGRHPRPADVKDMKAFHRFLRGAIRSVRYQQASTAAAQSEVLIALPNPENCEAVARLNPEEDVELRDLRDEFFIALREELEDPGQYEAVLEEWQQHFFTVKRLTELGLNYKDAWKLRQKARRLYRQLCEPVPKPPTIQPDIA